MSCPFSVAATQHQFSDCCDEVDWSGGNGGDNDQSGSECIPKTFQLKSAAIIASPKIIREVTSLTLAEVFYLAPGHSKARAGGLKSFRTQKRRLSVVPLQMRKKERCSHRHFHP